MKNLKSKIFASACSLLLANSAFAGTVTTNVNVTAVIVPGCVFNGSTFSAVFPAIPAGNVGETSGSFALVCGNTSTTYTVTPSADNYSFAGKEQVVVTAYTDAARTIPFTTTKPYSANTGSGTVTLYFRANGVGKFNSGKGPVLTEAQAFSVNIPMVLTF
jgi:hypothetical protein